MLAERITGRRWRWRSIDGGFGDVARGHRRHGAPARERPTTCRRRRCGRRRRGALGRQRPQRLRGPGTGYRLEGERWAASAGTAPRRRPRARSGSTRRRRAPPLVLRDEGEAAAGARADEVVIAVGPAFGERLRATPSGACLTQDVLAALRDGLREAGAEPRIVRVRHTSDVAFIGHDGARLSGSRRRDRAAVEGHGGDPPRRPAAARQPRAVRHGAAR